MMVYERKRQVSYKYIKSLDYSKYTFTSLEIINIFSIQLFGKVMSILNPKNTKEVSNKTFIVCLLEKRI